MPATKKTFPCGHRGFGRFCHRCASAAAEVGRQAQEHAARQAERVAWDATFAADPIDLRGLPHPELVRVAREVIAALAAGQGHRRFGGKQLMRAPPLPACDHRAPGTSGGDRPTPASDWRGMAVMSDLARFLCLFMERNTLTLRDMEVRSGISKSTLHALIRGSEQEPRLSTLVMIARVMNLPLWRVLEMMGVDLGLDVHSDPTTADIQAERDQRWRALLQRLSALDLAALEELLR